MRLLRWLTPLLVLASCRGSEIVSGVSESTYVRAMVELRKVPLSVTGDTLERARVRDSILQSLGVTAADLESAAVQLSTQPERAARLWRVIELTGLDR
ncbi:MAG TPA: hypothetical protein VF178_15125 [Gemmatimonadaceae bacterium]